MAQITSDLWKELQKERTVGFEYQFKISDPDGSNPVYYNESQEISHSVESALYDEFGIGNTFGAKLSLEVYADNIPRAAKIERFIRLKNGGKESEWLPKGVFFASKRTDDDGIWTLEAYDAMRKAEVEWTPGQSLTFPMPMQEASEIFAEIIGCELDDRSEIGPSLTIDYPANNYTVRQILSYIAAANCGNWIITDAGKLRLVSALPVDEVMYDVKLDLTELSDNKQMPPISRVTMSVDDDNVITSGDDSGLEVLADCPYATQEIVDAALEKLQGFRYWAFTSADVNIDPACELGDTITAGQISSVIAKITDDGSGFLNISAPGESDLEDEYPVSGGPLTRQMRKLAQSQSQIEKNSEEISLTISSIQNSQNDQRRDLTALSDDVAAANSRYDDGLSELNSQMAQLRLSLDQLEIAFQSVTVDEVTTKTGYTFNADGLDIHKDGDEIHNTIDNTGMYVKRGSGDAAVTMLQANADGVEATNLLAKNFLIVAHARFEDYGDGRTACFYL